MPNLRTLAMLTAAGAILTSGIASAQTARDDGGRSPYEDNLKGWPPPRLAVDPGTAR